MNTKSPIIEASDLSIILNNENVVLLDARVGKDAKQNFLKEHIKGARYVDLEKDLANVPEDAANGGRHPLPEIQVFAETLSNLGIANDSHIVIYDDKNGANAAARAWWMLKAFGIANVQVLNGGFQEAQKMGVAMSNGEEKFNKSEIVSPKTWLFPTKNKDEVESLLSENAATVVDVRDAYRYEGESEPIDSLAGHIPGAVNIPFSENIDASGKFLAPELLNEKYKGFLKDKPENLVIHCGSGVTACHTILALEHAGIKVPELYVGSWSEWSRSGKPVITKEKQ